MSVYTYVLKFEKRCTFILIFCTATRTARVTTIFNSASGDVAPGLVVPLNNTIGYGTVWGMGKIKVLCWLCEYIFWLNFTFLSAEMAYIWYGHCDNVNFGPGFGKVIITRIIA